MGGFFLTRLKDNLHPTIARSNLIHRGASIDLAGQPLRGVLDRLRRACLDVMIEVKAGPKGAYRARQWRVVGLRNEETGQYHLYLTNIPIERLTGFEIGQAYAYRWEIERLNAEMKGVYKLGTWAVTRDESMLVETYAVLIAWALNRRLRAAILTPEELEDPLSAALAAPLMRWAKVMTGIIHDLVVAVVLHRRVPHSYIDLIRSLVREPNRGRVPLSARTERLPRNARITPLAA